MNKSNTCLLCVDLSYQTYRAAAAHSNLTSGRHFTGGLYGFMSTVSKMIRETDATDLIVCCDSKPYRRSEEFPEYKAWRKKAQDPALADLQKETMKHVREVLEGLGVAMWSVPGFESDDLIAHAVTRNRHRFGRIVAGSNDSDLFQHLDISNFSIYVKDIADVWTLDKLRQVHGVTPAEFMHATALAGTHNDLPGIPRVGLATAIKALRDPALMRKHRATHAELIDRNLKLIKLPHADLPWDTAIPRHGRIYDDRKLYRLLSRFDIETTLSMVNAFNQVLK